MIITAENNYEDFDKWLAGKKKVLLVCGDSFKYLEGIKNKLEQIAVPLVKFSDFQPNPLYDSVVKGVEKFRDKECDCIMAVGGGSAMDVAKCIKLYATSSGDGADGSWLSKEVSYNSIPFLAIPTTAGTGSEATRYAVIYYKGIKQSITSENAIPETVLIDPNVLKTLPLYQKKSTMSDALCHAIESFWSVNSTIESREYSKKAIRLIMENMDGYLSNTEDGNAGMLKAAHIAGKAINITQTTAGHAMCYKITSLFGCAHGHAAILCDRVLFRWMINNIDKCIDPRGEEYLKDILDEIGCSLGQSNAQSGAGELTKIFNKLEFDIPKATEEQYIELEASVNLDRLKNHPISIDGEVHLLYQDIFS